MFAKVSQKLFPAEYGGETGNFEVITEYWVNKVTLYKQYFEEDVKYGIDNLANTNAS